MGRTSAELKRLSREQLNGHWGFAIGINLLLQMLLYAVLMPFYVLFVFSGQGMVQFIIYLIAVVIIGAAAMILQCGIIKIYLSFARKQETSIGMVFGEFSRRPERYVIGYFLVLGCGALCMLPGITCWTMGFLSGMVLASIIGVLLYFVGLVLLMVLVFRLALGFHLMIDHTDMGVLEAFQESSKLMEGHNGRLFYIYLSFLGWSLLGLLSCGLGTLWVMPYMTQTYVNFYRDVIGELDQEPQVVSQ